MKKIISISLGSSKRDKITNASFMNEEYILERKGCNSDLNRMVAEIKKADGEVDMITIGGIHINYITLKGKVPFRDAKKLVKAASITPVVDGENFREWIEPYFVKLLIDKGVIKKEQTVLFPMSANRLSMAKQFVDSGFKNIIYGDMVYDLGMNIPIYSLKTINRIAAIGAPIFANIPFMWLYPTGEKQEEMVQKRPDLFEKADIYAGDFHNIRRYLIPDLTNKIIITNTVTPEDREMLKQRKLKMLITFSPNFEGRTFGTNLINGVITLMIGKKPEETTKEEYIRMIEKLNIEPQFETLN